MRNIMKPSFESRPVFVVGSLAFAALALLLLLAAGFLWISDDFVLRGQVVPATNPKIMLWRFSFTLGGLFCGITALVCYRCYRRQCQEFPSHEAGTA
jgi:hypothetical protein